MANETLEIFTEKEKVQYHIQFIMHDMNILQKSMLHKEILFIPMIVAIVSVMSLLGLNLDVFSLFLLELFIILISFLAIIYYVSEGKIILLVFIVLVLTVAIRMCFFNILTMIYALSELILTIFFLFALYLLDSEITAYTQIRKLLINIQCEKIKDSEEIRKELEKIYFPTNKSTTLNTE